MIIKSCVQSTICLKILSVNNILTTADNNTQIIKPTMLEELMRQSSKDYENELTCYLSEP